MREPLQARNQAQGAISEVSMALEDIIREVVRDAFREVLEEAALKPVPPPVVQVSERRPEVKAYSVVDAARQLGISRSKLYELIAAGELETIQVGRRRLVSTAALDRLMDVHAEPRASGCRFCGGPTVASYRRDGDLPSVEVRVCSSAACHRQLADTVTW